MKRRSENIQCSATAIARRFKLGAGESIPELMLMDEEDFVSEMIDNNTSSVSVVIVYSVICLIDLPIAER